MVSPINNSFKATDHDISTNIKQQSVIEYLFKSGETSATKIHQKLFRVDQQKTIDMSNIHRWIQRFQKGDFNLNDKQRMGRPSTVDQMIQNDRKISTYDIIIRPGILKGSVLKLIDTLGHFKNEQIILSVTLRGG